MGGEIRHGRLSPGPRTQRRGPVLLRADDRNIAASLMTNDQTPNDQRMTKLE
jgi:hypothetical protein